MPLIAYKPHNFYGAQRELVDRANAVVADWVKQGYVLTLRQLFYRLVSANAIPNTKKQYKRLGNLMVQARMAGETDWNALEDLTRNVRAVRSWESPQDAVEWLARQYHTDTWSGQPRRVEVWIEKDALSSVFSPVCAELDVPFFSCRGYNSASEAWRASMRIAKHRMWGQEPVILHFGDHDPSGLDMTRDIEDRFIAFEQSLDVNRRALNMDQVKQYRLPPNPARVTDARYKKYKAIHGDKSWELDALEPSILAALVRDAVLEHRDEGIWKKAMTRERRETGRLKRVAAKWQKVVKAIK